MLDTVLSLVWTFLNSAPGVALLSAALLAGINAVYARKPEWQKYEGTIIAAIRAAEKAIPDGTPMQAADRLDKALRLVLQVYESRTGKPAADSVVAQFVEAIQVIHAKQEAAGALEPELKG